MGRRIHVLLPWLVLVVTAVRGASASLESPLLPEDSNDKVLSRHRRFLYPASTGWKISTTFELTIPLDSDISGTVVIKVPFTYTVDTGVLHELHAMDRLHATDLSKEEVDDVHACALRVVCEVAMVPESEGLLGEMLHLLLTPTHLLTQLPPEFRANDYIQAQIDGAIHSDCSAHQRLCPVSFFQILEGANILDLQDEFLNLYGLNPVQQSVGKS